MGTYAAKANGLFTMGYNIYAWFLLISTAGIPVAVAKQVAKYNTMREEEHSFALIRSFLSFMTGLGPSLCLGFVSLFSLASRFVRCGERPDSHHAEFGLGSLDFPIYECYPRLLPRDEQPETLCYEPNRRAGNSCYLDVVGDLLHYEDGVW